MTTVDRSHKSLLIVGGDRIGRKLLQLIQPHPDLIIAVDKSNSYTRVFRLLSRGSLTLADVILMAWAELRRPAPRVTFPVHYEIRTNRELADLIRTESIARILLFRAGLIITKRLLAEDVEFLNIHCASLKGYGGLASIRRALADGALDQCATLHRITEKIDSGEILREESYRLRADQSYFENEQAAYRAGIELALETLSSFGASEKREPS